MPSSTSAPATRFSRRCSRRSMYRSRCCSARAKSSGAEAEPGNIAENSMYIVKNSPWLGRAALSAVALMLAAAPASAQQTAEIKVGLAALVNAALPLHLAEAGGFYAKNGLKVTIVDAGGGTRGGRALATGERSE